MEITVFWDVTPFTLVILEETAASIYKVDLLRCAGKSGLWYMDGRIKDCGKKKSKNVSDSGSIIKNPSGITRTGK
jgi:hypothetical protein